MFVQNWTGAVGSVWDYIIPALIQLIGALILIFIGLVVARLIETAVKKIVTFSRIDLLLKKVGLDKFLQRAEVALDSGEFVGKIVYWFIVLVTVIAVSDFFGFVTLSTFIWSVLQWVFTDVLAMVIILLIAVIVAQAVKKIISASIKGTRMHSAKFISSVAWWAVMLFGAEMALRQFGIDTTFLTSSVQIIFGGIILSLSIATGLAFGLGGREKATEVIKKFEDHLNNK